MENVCLPEQYSITPILHYSDTQLGERSFFAHDPHYLRPTMPYPRFRIFMPLSELALSLRDALVGACPSATAEFAAAFARLSGAGRAVPVDSGRGGFRLLLEEMNLPRGSEIVFPAYTFHPMPVVAAECGFTPVFADVDPGTWTLDPASLASRITPRTSAIVPTHLFGVPAELEKILALARERRIAVIEDCAHALGALCSGRPVGSIGDAGLFTFAMSKSLPCWGGGAVIVRDAALADRLEERLRPAPSGLAVLREQFSNILALLVTQPAFFPWTLYPLIRIATSRGSGRFDEPFLEDVVPPASPSSDQLSVISNQSLITDHRSLITGLSPFQASVGLRQLQRFPDFIARQTRNARILREGLAGVAGIELQGEAPSGSSAFLYVRARVEEPRGFRRRLLAEGIDTKPDDMRDCSSLGIFGGHPPCPVAARLGGHCVELPCSPFYTERQMEKLAGKIGEAITGKQ